MYLNYIFNNFKLFQISTNHPSLTGRSEISSYERMEFLGDSILNFIIVNYIYIKYASVSEGCLSIILSNLINSKAIITIANQLRIYDFIQMSLGEEQNSGILNSNNLESSIESIIAAIYLDSNFLIIEKIIKVWWKIHILNYKILLRKNPKTELQEWMQKKYKLLPEYKIKNIYNNKIQVLLSINNIYTISMLGDSRKKVEESLAERMLLLLGK